MIDSSELPFPFSLIFKYFWLLAILGSFVYVPLFKMKVNPYIKEDPSLEDGYNKLILGVVLFVTIPWAVIGIGMLFGKFDSIFDVFLGMRNWNFFSLLFFGTEIVLSILIFVWIWFWGGTEFLVRHHGIFSHSGQSPLLIKTRAAAIVVVSILLPFIIVNGGFGSF